MPKRKSEVTVSSDTEDVPSTSKKVKKESSSRPTADEGPNGSTSKAVQRKEDAKQQELEAFEQSVESGEFEIYDDCNEIRRKIRLLLKEPGFKITHWLRDDLGGVNSNSYGRFMKATGATGGAENSTYSAAYVYFEKRRIKEGKKKTAKRIQNEGTFPSGMPLQDRRKVWVFVGR